MKIKCFFAFAGYDAQQLALKRLHRDYPEFEYESAGYSEIDKSACQAHEVLHPGDHNWGDVTKIDWRQVPCFDLLTWSSPCQSVSKCGSLKGMEEGDNAASAVIWSIKDCLNNRKPKYILIENVSNIVGKRFIGKFNEFQMVLRRHGYKCFCQKLNAKDYGSVQSRNRLFLVAVREDYMFCDDNYIFPEPIKREKTLSDVLEDHVDEKYYLSEKNASEMMKTIDLRGIMRSDKILLGWTRDAKGNIVDRHPVSIANCVTANRRDNTMNYVLEGNRIRKLSTRELFRLMDVEDADIDMLINGGISDSQLKKMAGNSICVNVLCSIFRNMFKLGVQKQTTLFG